MLRFHARSEKCLRKSQVLATTRKTKLGRLHIFFKSSYGDSTATMSKNKRKKFYFRSEMAWRLRK